MNVLFLLALALIALFTLFGIKVGLIRRVVEFVGMVVSFFLATNLAPRFHLFIAKQTGLEEMIALYLCWFVLFILGLVATRFIAWGVSKTLRISIIGWADRLGGAVLGFLIGTVLASVVLIGVSQLPGGEAIRDAFNERPVPRMVYRAAPTLVQVFRKLGGDEQEVWDRLVEEAKKHTQLSSNAPAVGPHPSPSFAARDMTPGADDVTASG
jgi:membrane protein required for colicin V production